MIWRAIDRLHLRYVEVSDLRDVDRAFAESSKGRRTGHHVRAGDRPVGLTLPSSLPQRADPKKPNGVGRYGVGASVAAWLMSCWAASHWPARRVRAVSRIASALAN